MPEIIIATYASRASVRNVLDDLLATGFPRERIRVDDDQCEVQVVGPVVAGREITEILQRHQPLGLRTQRRRV